MDLLLLIISILVIGFIVWTLFLDRPRENLVDVELKKKAEETLNKSFSKPKSNASVKQSTNTPAAWPFPVSDKPEPAVAAKAAPSKKKKKPYSKKKPANKAKNNP